MKPLNNYDKQILAFIFSITYALVCAACLKYLGA